MKMPFKVWQSRCRKLECETKFAKVSDTNENVLQSLTK